MSIFKYIYNVSFIIFFAVVMSRCSVTYGMTQRRGFKLMGQLFLAYIFESVYVELIEIMYVVTPDFEKYLLAGIDVYASTMISAVEIYIFSGIIEELIGKKSTLLRVLAALLEIIIMIAGNILKGDMGSFLAFSSYSIPLLVICLYYWIELQRKTEVDKISALKYRGIIAVTTFFSLLILVENVIYILAGKASIEWMRQFLERRINYADDLFSVVLGIMVMYIASNVSDAHMAETIEKTVQDNLISVRMKLAEAETELKQATEEKMRFEDAATGTPVMQLRQDSRQLSEFCEKYGLTERESEILKILVGGKSNQEIADALMISIGTVKAHVHSIYGKLEVRRRSQLMNVFSTYEIETRKIESDQEEV